MQASVIGPHTCHNLPGSNLHMQRQLLWLRSSLRMQQRSKAQQQQQQRRAGNSSSSSSGSRT
jgi:hypothetical protein